MFIERGMDEDVVYLHNGLLLLLFSHPVVSNSLRPWTAAHQSSLSFTISQSLPKFMSIALVKPSSNLILWCPLLLLPLIFPRIRNFSSESAVIIRWQKQWRFSFIIHSIMEYYSAIKKNKITTFAAIWMYLKIGILSEVSQTKGDKHHIICGI